MNEKIDERQSVAQALPSSLYVNGFMANSGPADATFILTQGDQPVVQVIMAYTTMKQMGLAIADLLKVYEEAAGEIVIPANELQQRFMTVAQKNQPARN